MVGGLFLKESEPDDTQSSWGLADENELASFCDFL